MTQNKGQALATTQQGGALVAIENPVFNLPILVDPQEALEIMAENQQDLGREFNFPKIKVPSGGSISFEITNENGKVIPVTEIKGIILDKFALKTWYIKSFEEKTDEDTGIPDCWSPDNERGTGCEAAGIPAGQLCKDCPKGQWGSDRKGGRGKDCQDKIRVYILQENEMFPVFIDLPPTSTKNFVDYIQRITNKKLVHYSVVTSISLEKAKSDSKIEYSKTVFHKEAELSQPEKMAIKEYIKSLKDAMRRITKESFAEKPVEATVIDNSTDENPY